MGVTAAASQHRRVVKNRFPIAGISFTMYTSPDVIPRASERVTVFHNPDQYQTMPLGVVVRRAPGVTRWTQWSWQAVAVLPGARPADWAVLRSEGDVTEYHAATRQLELHGAECEAYMAGLSDKMPSIYVIMRKPLQGDRPLDIVLVTASPFEAQDYMDNGEDIVEKVPMPAGLLAWVRDFTDRFFAEEVFIKRRRNKGYDETAQDGIGDARIAQMSDVYRAPGRKEGTR